MGKNSENRMQRQFCFEIRAKHDEKNGDYIEGRPIVYDSETDLGYFDEIIERGALEQTDLRDVRFLVNHNTNMIPLARSRNNSEDSTMQMSVDEKGMIIRVNLDTENNSEARSLYSAVRRGDISGMSFMFIIENEEWERMDTDHPLRRITKIKQVLEVSAVTFPAYEETELNARDKAALDSARNTLESAKRHSLDSELELEKEKLRNRIMGIRRKK